MNRDPSRNLYLLMAMQACFLASSMTIYTFVGLAGNMLSGAKAFATLPISLAIVANALTTIPMSNLMQRTSRRFGFRVGALSGMAAAAICSYALYSGDFLLLCVGCMGFGVYQASSQYYRYAAAESVPAAKAPRAISLVLLGGLFAATVVPTLTAWFNEAFLPYTFMGGFIFFGAAAAFALLPMAFLRSTDHLRPKRDEGETAVARPLGQIAKQPDFIVAVLNGALGYAMMSFVMTATPLAMDFCGFAPTTSAHVIQMHVMAMFVPSLFTGYLITRFGLTRIMMAGHLFFLVAFVTALAGIKFENFSVALIALGLGWNFCFVGGTSLLTTIPTEEEKGKLQGLNELIVSATMATASFSAGLIQNYFGWETVNMAAFVMLAVVATATGLWAISRKRTQVA